MESDTSDVRIWGAVAVSLRLEKRKYYGVDEELHLFLFWYQEDASISPGELRWYASSSIDKLTRALGGNEIW